MRKTIFLGDSITEGFHLLSQHNHVVNMGIGGDKTLDIIERLENVKQENPDQLFLMIGINDIMNNNKIWFSNLPIDSKRTYRFIVEYLVNNLNTKEIILLSILPIASIDVIDIECEDDINNQIDEMNKLIEKVANQYSLIYINLNAEFKHNKRLKKNLTTDGIHLAEEGYQLFYKKIINFLNISEY